MKTLLKLTAVIIVLGFSAYVITSLRRSGSTAGEIDLLQYWAAAKLFASGANPYDPQQIKLLEEQVSTPYLRQFLPIIMWNPPHVLPLISVFAIIDFNLLVGLYFAVGIGIIVYSSLVTARWAIPSVERRYLYPTIIFLLTFYPFFASLSYGQITPLLLIGFCLYTSRVAGKENIAGSFTGGLWLSLTTLKPHLLYLTYLYIFIVSLQTRKWRTVAGVSTGVIILSALTTLWQPSIWTYYFSAAGSPPIYWRTPTLGCLLQGTLNWHSVIPRFLPTLVTTATALLVLSSLQRRYSTFQLLLLSIPVSLVTSPYGWLYDQSLVIPLALYVIGTVLQSGGAKGIAIPVCLIALNILMVFPSGPYNQEHYWWFPILLTALAILATPQRATSYPTSYPQGT